MLDEVIAELGRPTPVELGVMVETPAAAVSADILASEADFMSIGTNDLTQYVLAMDRGNPKLAGRIDALHPAVLRMISQTCLGAGPWSVGGRVRGAGFRSDRRPDPDWPGRSGAFGHRGQDRRAEGARAHPDPGRMPRLGRYGLAAKLSRRRARPGRWAGA